MPHEITEWMVPHSEVSRIRKLIPLRGQSPPEDVAETLYERFYDRTVRIVLSMTGDRECAIEAAQEAFIRAFERFETLHDQDKFGGWVASIAVNAARDILRRRRHELIDADLASRPKTDLDLPEQALLRRENALSVQEAIAALPPLYRTIIILRYVAERDIADISKALGIPEGTVKSRLHRGRMLLRGIIQRLNDAAEGGMS